MTIATYATFRYTFATFIRNSCNIPLKHLKHLKHTITTCDVSQCGLLRRLQQSGAAVAGGEAGGLPCQGPTLLLEPTALVGVVGREHARVGLGGQLTAEEAVPTRGRSGARTVRQGERLSRSGRQERSGGCGGLSGGGGSNRYLGKDTKRTPWTMSRSSGGSRKNI
jgi:hypothetical protein